MIAKMMARRESSYATDRNLLWVLDGYSSINVSTETQWLSYSSRSLTYSV